MQWLARYERFWTERLDALAKFVEEDAACSPSQASPSSAASKPAGASLQRVDGPAKNSPLVRAHRDDWQARCAPRWTCASGGRYRMRFKTEDGESHEVGGVYREVVPNSRLVFTWAWHSTPERESLVTVTVAKDGDGTMLTLTTSSSSTSKARDGHNARLDRHARQARAVFRLVTEDHGQETTMAKTSAKRGAARRSAAKRDQPQLGARQLPLERAENPRCRARQALLSRTPSAGPSRPWPRPTATPTGSPCRTASRSPACSR